MLSKIYLCLFLLATGSGILPVNAAAATIRVAVASNFLLPMKALSADFEKQTGNHVSISVGSTGKLYAQITHGAPYDIFFAANSREPQRLEKAGFAVAGSRATYAVGQIALWGANTTDPKQTLASGKFRRLAIANPRIAPYGVAAQQTLQSLKLEKQLKQKIIQAENISQAYQFAVTGNTELGFVAYSQLVARGDEKHAWLVPAALHDPIEQQYVLLTRAGKNSIAHAFIEYLNKPEAKRMITDFGYGLGS